MASFSVGLRSLFGVNQVTGLDDQTKIFQEVREDVWRNAVIYKDKVLPVTTHVVRSIGLYMSSFIDVEFDDWAENLDDFLDDINKGIGFCEYLKQLHNSIIIDLKRNEDKAAVGQQKMALMASDYKKMAEDLEQEAKGCKDRAEAKEFWGQATAAFTAGISTMILNAFAQKDEEDAARKASEAAAKSKNAEIAIRAVSITNNVVIPAIKDFLDGIHACSGFLIRTRESLEEMKNYGEHGPKKVYYQAMRNRAAELKETCLMFQMMTNEMSTGIDAIPEPSDKNYVDVWFEKQQAEFRENHKSAWALIAHSIQDGLRRLKVSSISQICNLIIFEMNHIFIGEYLCSCLNRATVKPAVQEENFFYGKPKKLKEIIMLVVLWKN